MAELFEYFAPTVLLVPTRSTLSYCNNHLLPLLQKFKRAEQLNVQRQSLDDKGNPYKLNTLAIRWKLLSSDKEWAEFGQFNRPPAPTQFIPSPTSLQAQLKSPRLSISVQENSQMMEGYRAINETSSNEDSLMQTTTAFSEFIKGWIRQSEPTEHETFHHPVAFVFVIGGNEASSGDINQLYMKTIDSTYINPEVLRFNLVLHVEGEMNAQISENKLMEIKSRYGLHCHLLKITKNKQQENLLDVENLALEDVDHAASNAKAINLFLRELASQSLIPFMDAQMQKWNEQVASSRRGLTRNLLQTTSKFFSTGSRSTSNIRHISVPSLEPSVMKTVSVYPYSAPEAIMRKLGDFAFMLGDYRFAEGIYRIVKKDYQSEKAYRFYAGVLEMIGICHLLLQEKKDVEAVYETSIAHYKNFHESLLRCSLLYHEAYKLTQNFREAAKVLIRLISDVDALQAAMFYEQAAICCLKLDRPLKRKYAFYLYMAGKHYLDSDRPQHFTRCFRTVLKLLEGRGWLLIDDYLNFKLGEQYLKSGQFELALKSFDSTLRKNKEQHPELQVRFMAGYAKAYDGLKRQSLDSTVPEVLSSSLKLMGGDRASHSIVGRGQEEIHAEEQWHHLEESFSTGKAKVSVYAMFEPVQIQIKLKNPLSIPLQINNALLQCFHSTEKGATVPDLLAAPQEDANWFKFDGFWLQKLPGFKLQPNETREVEWQLVPQAAGFIQFVGLKFQLNGKMNLMSKVNRSGADVFTMTVSPPMPRLDLELLKELPETMLSGEVQHRQITLRNAGKQAISNISVKMIHPNFFAFGDFSKAVSSNKIDNALSDFSLISIPLENGKLLPGAAFSIPVVARADKIGQHAFKFLFAYYPEGTGSVRFYRWSLNLNVVPSLKVNVFARPSSASLDDYLLGMELENLKTDVTFKITQITALSASWKMSEIPNASIIPDLSPRLSMFSYYKLHKQLETRLEDTPEYFTSSNIIKWLSGEKKIFPKAPSIELITSDLVKTKQVDALSDFRKHLTSIVRCHWRLNHLKALFPLVSAEKFNQLFTLYTMNDLDLILFWETSTGSTGHHYVIGVPLSLQEQPLLKPSLITGVGRSLFARTIREQAALLNSLTQNKHIKDECPLKAMLVPDMTEIQHSFKSHRTLTVKVQLKLKNVSPSRSCSYKLDFKSQNPITLKFYWQGAVTRVGNLEPLKSELIDATLIILRPGVYDLNQWKIEVQSEKATYNLVPSYPCFLRVESSD